MRSARRAGGWGIVADLGRLSAPVSILLLLTLAACGGPPPRDLAELVVADSLYVDPMTRTPYTGPIFRAFADNPDVVEVEGGLLDGTWDGELVVYHPNGRVRYMGSFVAGDRCGPWTENADSTATESAYDALLREIETMGLYPPCNDLPSSND